MSIRCLATQSIRPPAQPVTSREVREEKPEEKKKQDIPTKGNSPSWSSHLQKKWKRLTLFEQMRLLNETHPQFKKANAIYQRTIGSEIPDDGPDVSEDEGQIISEESISDKILKLRQELDEAGTEKIEAQRAAFEGKLQYLIKLSKLLTRTSQLFLNTCFKAVCNDYDFSIKIEE
ncbi:MAG TPA: hypothetical protein VLG44_02180 [Chlamydiales bacterium]|nr:hypothetical protein [Chlamydiales bacterium]